MNDIAVISPTHLQTAAAQMVSSRLPALTAKSDPLNRSNSQTTLAMMTLTMMTGQSPMRQIRQILAEIDAKKAALAEAQLGHAELQAASFPGSDEVSIAKERLNGFRIQALETKIQNAIKDIATLICAYDALVAAHGIEDWTEEDFERAEAKHHVRRGFELLYRNVIECGRPKEATIEYMQQFGVHVQVAIKEVSGFIIATEGAISDGDFPDASSIEQFLDQMAEKYQGCVKVAAKRMFGREDIVNTTLMSSMEK